MRSRRQPGERDYVDQMLDDWALERPDLDLSPLGVIGRISRVSRRFDREISKVFHAFGLSSWGFYVLAALNRAGPPYQLTPTELYRSLLVSSGLMTSRIVRLEQAGLVRRVPDPADGRSVLVALTDEGRELVNIAIEHHNRNEAAMLSPLTEEERRLVAASLRKLLIASGDVPRGTGTGRTEGP
ncbi:MAG: MarR family winged helix-turn-helix transcriptional regulator [Candidatus Limnocylindria bacterium]